MRHQSVSAYVLWVSRAEVGWLSDNKKERDYNLLAVIPEFLTGAEEETRTLTPVRELDPEPSVSTNFTTSAAGMCLDDLPCFGKRFFALQKILCFFLSFSTYSSKILVTRKAFFSLRTALGKELVGRVGEGAVQGRVTHLASKEFLVR